jgi:hypothetical protein
MDSMKLFWGLVIALLGIAFIGTNLGWWTSAIWWFVWSLWPIILIAFGLKLIVTDERLLGILLIALLAAAVIFVAYGVSNGTKVNVNRNFFGMRVSSETFSEDITDQFDPAVTKNLNVTVSTGAAQVSLKALPSTAGKDVLYRFKSTDMGELEVKKTASGDTVTLVVSEDNVGMMPFNRSRLVDRQLEIYLPEPLMLDLKLDSGASKLDADFSSLSVSNVRLNIGASSGDIRLSSKISKQTLRLDAGASGITFHVPTGLGVKATLDGGLNTVNYDSALEMTKNGDTYVTKNFENATNQIVITSSTGVSSIRFEKN